jgi:hypothetical protein
MGPHGNTKAIERLYVLSLSVRNVPGMSVRQEDEISVPLPIDPLTGRPTDILDELAAAVLDEEETTDAVRIDRLALLEKLRAVTGALQAAESVKFAQSQVAEQFGCGRASECDRSRHRRTDSPRMSHLPGDGGAPVGYGAGIVVRTARHL